jgi:D-glycero-D-manno-heptose 1,7-bisphosphate phosphatase
VQRLILLDRDGVINEDSPAYVKSLAEWRPLPGSLEAIARLSRAGRLIAVVTNQSGLARGLFDRATLEAMHGELRARVAALGGRVDAIRYCPHGPEDRCACRKPAPGLIHEAEAALGVSARGMPLVGDSPRDLEAARAAGCVPVLVRTGNGRDGEAAARALGCAVFDDLAAFAEHELTA